MTPHQFTWYMVVNSLTAIGTIGAVIVALFGKKFFRPKLAVTLANPQGEVATWKKGDGKEGKARFYQARITNKRRWSAATNISLHLVAVHEERSDNEFHEDWSGDVQMRWKHTSSFPQPSYVGKPVDYDLANVNRDGFVQLNPIVAASLNTVRTGKCRFQIVLQARATECDSPLVRVEISWDGKWEDATESMAKHFIIKMADANG